jgi:murein L,D-transpeptidase YcbB/YkuD
MFAGPISRIEFSPYWYVPTSIARKAVVPRLRRDPGYLKRKGMEFRLPNGQLTQRVTASILDRAARGSVKIQQRSGPSNALGKVKFILPNRRAVFMHDTANRKLFGKDKRALSYGCVRVQKPLALAKLLLADQAQWTGTAVEKAADYGKTVRANTTEKTMVMLQYLTAVSDNAGTMQFLPDVYKFDKAAKRIVARWSKPRLPATPDAALMARLQQADLG